MDDYELKDVITIVERCLMALGACIGWYCGGLLWGNAGAAIGLFLPAFVVSLYRDALGSLQVLAMIAGLCLMTLGAGIGWYCGGIVWGTTAAAIGLFLPAFVADVFDVVDERRDYLEVYIMIAGLCLMTLGAGIGWYFSGLSLGATVAIAGLFLPAFVARLYRDERSEFQVPFMFVGLCLMSLGAGLGWYFSGPLWGTAGAAIGLCLPSFIARCFRDDWAEFQSVYLVVGLCLIPCGAGIGWCFGGPSWVTNGALLGLCSPLFIIAITLIVDAGYSPSTPSTPPRRPAKRNEERHTCEYCGGGDYNGHTRTCEKW